MASNGIKVAAQTVQRITDITAEPLAFITPIGGYEKMPLVSLEEAVKSLVPILPTIQSHAYVAKQRCQDPADGLSADESASIMLYTMEWEPHNECLYFALNDVLRSSDRRNLLEPWYLYLRLFLNALFRLPPVNETIHRGVKLNMSDRYVKGKIIVWWGFSSCTTDVEVLKSKEFLGNSGPRTLFYIQCQTARNICKHSYFPNEQEVLLFAATQFQVTGCLDQGDLCIVHLKETLPPFPLLRPVPIISQDKKISSSEKATVLLRRWLDLQFHDGQVKKPDEIQVDMPEPATSTDEEILDRIKGSMIGLAIGDALGSPAAFQPYSYLVAHPVKDLEGGGTWGLDKGQFAIYTSMALCLANSLVVCRDFVPYDQLVRYKWWYKHGYMSATGRCFDIGKNTRDSIVEFERRQKRFAKVRNIAMEEVDYFSDREVLRQFDVYCSDNGAAGNAGLTRLAPVPLFFYKYPRKAVEFSGQSGQITHGDQRVYDACRYFGALLVAAVLGETKEQLLSSNFYHLHRSWFGDKPLHPDIMQVTQGSYKQHRGYDDGIRGKSYIVNAIEAALWAFWCDENSFEKGFLAAVNLGDDTNSTAAVYGQIAGAYYGYRGLPQPWLEHLYARDFLRKLSEWITYEGQHWRPQQILDQE